ncbi:MAG: Ig domain-containing protein [Steroidobacteraceae bacterium]
MLIVDICLAARRLTQALILVAATVLVAVPALAANYPLELVSPRAAGSSPAAGFEVIPAGHRIFRAHPSVQYNIRAVVIGGSYPFSFALANAPTGMTIHPATGEINWPSPTGVAVTPTLTVTDAEGTRVSSSWTISVTTDGFKFLSPNGNDSASGSIDAPWRTLAKLHSSSTPSDIIYLRSGTYTTMGIPRGSVGTAWERVEYGSDRSARWLAIPGETPVIDFGYIAGVDPSAIIRFQNSSQYPIYLEGLEGRNFRNIGFQIVSSVSNFTVLRKLRIHDMILGVDGENPAGIMFTSGYSDASQYAAVQDSEFYRLNNGGGLKVYSQKKMIIENNVFRDSTGGFDLKSHVPRFDVRGNTFLNIETYSLFGNMHENNGEPASGEIRFNNINTRTAMWSLEVNQDCMGGEMFIGRNTIVGGVRLRCVQSTNGPFSFFNNVIVNNNPDTLSGLTYYNVVDRSRISTVGTLYGGSDAGIVDSNGLLTSSYQQYLGTHGHQLGTSPIVRPNPPIGVVLE